MILVSDTEHQTSSELIYKQGLIQQILTYQGITLDVGFDPYQDFIQPESMLANFRFACHFSAFIQDKVGSLSPVQDKTIAPTICNPLRISDIDNCR